MAGGRMGLPTGVELIGKSIRIRFTVNGERRSETLAHPQTAKGIKAAADLRAQVISLAKHGVLDEKRYAELFPASSYIAKSREILLGEYAQTWLDSLEVVDGSRRNYLGLMNNYWMPHLAMMPIKAINTMDLRRVVAETEWKTPTIKRAAIARIKAMFRSAILDGVVEKNPAAAIQLPAKTKKQIAPFSVDEAERIIAWMNVNLSKRLQIFAAFYEFAFYTGMRTGEIMALQWGEVDLENKTAHVCRIVVDHQLVERTKTKYTRTVKLNSRALAALQKAKSISEDPARHVRRVSNPSPFVFQPLGGSPHMMVPDTPGRHFNLAVRELGLPARPQYNCRHTYATMCLMSGINPAFIASQLGHSVQVLLTTYAKWLNSSNDWAEIEKLERVVIGTNSVQD